MASDRGDIMSNDARLFVEFCRDESGDPDIRLVFAESKDNLTGAAEEVSFSTEPGEQLIHGLAKSLDDDGFFDLTLLAYAAFMLGMRYGESKKSE